MTSSSPFPPVADQSSIAAQDAPVVSRWVFMAAGLGAILSGILMLLGSNDPATISMPVFFLAPLVPAVAAFLLWLPLSFTEKTETRRQTVSAAGVLAIVGAVFFFVEYSARFELSLYFALILFAWGSRLKFAGLKWATLPYLAAAIALRVFDFPGEAFILVVLGALTVAWPFLAGKRS